MGVDLHRPQPRKAHRMRRYGRDSAEPALSAKPESRYRDTLLGQQVSHDAQHGRQLAAVIIGHDEHSLARRRIGHRARRDAHDGVSWRHHDGLLPTIVGDRNLLRPEIDTGLPGSFPGAQIVSGARATMAVMTTLWSVPGGEGGPCKGDAIALTGPPGHGAI